jgi:hypothetical protein
MSAKPKQQFSDPAPLDQAALAAIIAASRPEDYDGHTEFNQLSPRARLEWLESAVSFAENARKAREARGHSA